MNFGRKTLTLAVLTIALFGASAANAFETYRDFETTASIPQGKSIQHQANEDEDDDEAFFSSGAKISHTVPQFQKAPQLNRKPLTIVDAGAICREVLADDLSLYNRQFVAGCQKTLTQQPFRRAAR